MIYTPGILLLVVAGDFKGETLKVRDVFKNGLFKTRVVLQIESKSGKWVDFVTEDADVVEQMTDVVHPPAEREPNGTHHT